MRPDGRDDGRKELRLDLHDGSETERESTNEAEQRAPSVVFDFTGLRMPDLRDLSLVLTARLQTEDEDCVYVRGLPNGTWDALHAMGLDHMFRADPLARGSLEN